MQKEKRGKKRKSVTGPLHFRCSKPDKQRPHPADLPDVGIIVNESETGLCFIATCPIETGRSLLVNCPGISRKTEPGTVRWCHKAAIDLWCIGLQKSA